jgi:REP element-mobilizing transposase RayT
MSLPEQYLPNKTYVVAQRCFERRFFLKPSPQVDQVFLFCLLHAAAKYNVRVHAYAVLSNHYHVVLTDVEANLPDCVGWLNAQMARCLNALYGRWEGFWNARTYSRVVLADPESVLDEIAYTIGNPVSSELVETPEEWPGLVSMPEDFGKSLSVDRPEWYFRRNGPVPERVSGVLTLPPAFEHMGEFEFKTLVRGRVDAKVEEVRFEVENRGGAYLGREAVLAQHWNETPKSVPPRPTLNPRIACKDSDLRQELLEARKEFQQQHRDARLEFCEGDREVLFPHGTFWMRRYAGVKCRPPPPT